MASYGINVSLWRLERETVSYFFLSCICGKQTLNKAILSSQKKKKKIFNYNSLPVWFYFACLFWLYSTTDVTGIDTTQGCCQCLWSMKVDNEQLKSAVTESCPDTFPHWETATWDTNWYLSLMSVCLSILVERKKIQMHNFSVSHTTKLWHHEYYQEKQTKCLHIDPPNQFWHICSPLQAIQGAEKEKTIKEFTRCQDLPVLKVNMCRSVC